MYKFRFYFPTFTNEKIKVEFDYMTSDGTTDPIKKTVECKKENNYYPCFIPVKNKDQLIAGITTILSEKKGEEDVVFSSSSMYVTVPQ
ncbi:hypothetical protein [Chryseobacterium pennae]|nr:hypothetical protein [Chryseobacterium pennae]